MTDVGYPASVVGQGIETPRVLPPRPDVLSAAVVAALGELSDVPKGHSAKGRSFDYAYADLADVHAVTRPVLARHGLAAMQDVSTSSDAVTVTTFLLHVSGERLSFGPFRLPCGDGPQAVGSAVTYARRYALMAALGIAASSDDDDGHTAQRESEAVRPPASPPRRAGGPESSPPPGGPEGQGVVAGTAPGGGDDQYLARRMAGIDAWRERLAALDGYDVTIPAKQAFVQVAWHKDWHPTHTTLGILEAALKRLEPEVVAAEHDRDGTTVDPPAPEPVTQDPYEGWTLAALRAEARRRGLVDAIKLTKLPIVALLHDFDERMGSE